jgi:prevent-host-death family protein
MAKTVTAPDFEAHCLALIDEVAEKREEVTIVKDGKPLAKVVPVTPRFRTLEELRGSVKILGDIVEPIDVEWDVEK